MTLRPRTINFEISTSQRRLHFDGSYVAALSQVLTSNPDAVYARRTPSYAAYQRRLGQLGVCGRPCRGRSLVATKNQLWHDARTPRYTHLQIGSVLRDTAIPRALQLTLDAHQRVRSPHLHS